MRGDDRVLASRDLKTVALMRLMMVAGALACGSDAGTIATLATFGEPGQMALGSAQDSGGGPFLPAAIQVGPRGAASPMVVLALTLTVLDRWLVEHAPSATTLEIVDADGRVVIVGPVARSESEFIDVIKAAARRLGLGERRWDTTEPILYLQLPDGSRLTAVLGGRSERGMAPVPIVSIRRHRYSTLNLDDLVSMGALSPLAASFLKAAVLARRTILVAGGTNTGKTTLLRAMCSDIPEHERLITVERDLLELGLHHSTRHRNVVPLYSRQANVEGEGEVTVAQLVQATLRLNPSRVIVGEVLGDEVVPMLNAMSQGNDGSMCTIHADSSEATFSRLATYAVQAPERLSHAATSALVAGAVHFVVFVDADRHPDRPMRRFVASIREVTGLADSERVSSSEVFALDANQELQPASALAPRHRELFARFGYTPANHRPSARQMPWAAP